MKVLKYFSLAVFSISIVGCSHPSSPATADKSKKVESASATTEVFHSKLPDSAPTLKVATVGNIPPFSLQDNYGNMSGFDIDVIRAIGEAEGFKVNFFKETWDDMFISVDTQKDDLAIAGISYKPERAEKYNLSNSYFYNPAAIMYKNPQLNIKNIADLKGLRVGAMTGTKQLDTIKQANIASKISEYPTTFLLYQGLIRDEVDAVLQDYPLLKDTANNHPNYKVTIVPYEKIEDPLAQQVILMKKGNDKLLAQINEGISKIKADGTLKSIESKWKITVDTSSLPSMSSATSAISSTSSTIPTK